MAGRERSAFETFWIAKGAPPGSQREIENYAQERKREAREARGMNLGGFVSADAPLVTWTVHKQKRLLPELAELATSEASAISPGEWPDYIGLDENFDEARSSLLSHGGALPEAERQEEREEMAMEEDFDEQAIEREIRDQLQEFGVEAVVDALVGNPAPDELQERVDDVTDVVDKSFYEDMIEAEIRNLYDRLGQNVDIIREGELEELARGAPDEEEIREEVLERLENAFGQRYESVQDAINKLKERLGQARGQRTYVANIRVRRLENEFRIRIEDGDRFTPYRDVVERRVKRELDLNEIRQGETVMVGTITLSGDDLQEIDLSRGRERLGATAEPQPAPEEVGEPEQVPIEQAAASQVADRFLELAEED